MFNSLCLTFLTGDIDDNDTFFTGISGEGLLPGLNKLKLSRAGNCPGVITDHLPPCHSTIEAQSGPLKLSGFMPWRGGGRDIFASIGNPSV